MRKRAAIRFWVVSVSLTASYLLWSLRIFYTVPELSFDPRVGAAAQEAIRDWHKRSGHVHPEKPTTDRILHALFHPFATDDRQILVPVSNPVEQFRGPDREEILVIHDTGFAKFMREFGGTWMLLYEQPL